MNSQLIMYEKDNPILSSSQWPYPVNAVFNPGATMVNEQVLLLVRVEDRRGISHVTKATSSDGTSNWNIDCRPFIAADGQALPEEQWGIEDPRITYMVDEDRYVITYCAYSEMGPAVALAETKDFEAVIRLGVSFVPENKDAALFPEKINGSYALIHRPVCAMGNRADIWVSFSSDLIHWGNHKRILSGRSGPWWDSGKIGLNTPPLRVPEGWLIAYHGVRKTCFGSIYRVGFALLDYNNPTKVLGRSSQWQLGPQEKDARIGDVGNVVFPCGWIEKQNKLFIYYGMADTHVGVAQTTVSAIIASLE